MAVNMLKHCKIMKGDNTLPRFKIMEILSEIMEGTTLKRFHGTTHSLTYYNKLKIGSS